MKKILFLTKNFPPEVGGGIRRIKAIYDLLLNNSSLEVEVITAQKDSIKEYKDVRYIKQLFFKDNLNNRKISFERKKTEIKLFDKALIGWLPNVLVNIASRKYDIIFTSVPSFTNLIICFLYKKLIYKKTKLIADYRDFFSFNPSYIENYKKKIFKFIERIILKNCDYVIVTTKAMKKILGRYKDKKYIFVVKNYICENDKKISMRLKKINLERSFFNLGYTGKLNTGRDPSTILNLLKEKINKKNVALHFIGISDEAGRGILKIAEALNLNTSNIFIRGMVSREKSLQYMKSFDGLLLIINNESLIKNGYGIPGKLYDYIQINNNIYSDLDSFHNIRNEFSCRILKKIGNIVNFKINDNNLLDDIFNKTMSTIIRHAHN